MTGRSAGAAVVYRVGGSGTAWRQAGDEVVVLDTETSVYFGLDRFGALLWTRLVDGATTADLVADLVAATAVEPERAGADVQRFLDTLLRYGLIQVS